MANRWRSCRDYKETLNQDALVVGGRERREGKGRKGGLGVCVLGRGRGKGGRGGEEEGEGGEELTDTPHPTDALTVWGSWGGGCLVVWGGGFWERDEVGGGKG